MRCCSRWNTGEGFNWYLRAETVLVIRTCKNKPPERAGFAWHIRLQGEPNGHVAIASEIAARVITAIWTRVRGHRTQRPGERSRQQALLPILQSPLSNPRLFTPCFAAYGARVHFLASPGSIALFFNCFKNRFCGKAFCGKARDPWSLNQFQSRGFRGALKLSDMLVWKIKYH